MTHGFEDDPANVGYPQREPAELRAQIVEAHLAGWQVATHAIGDAAVRFVLDAYEAALTQLPRPDHRHRIEHCGVTTPGSLARIARLGVIPVPQGRFVGELGDGMLAALGEQRAADTYRLASFLRAGVVLPGSSDRPVVDGRPMLGIADMVARRTESGQPFSVSGGAHRRGGAAVLLARIGDRDEDRARSRDAPRRQARRRRRARRRPPPPRRRWVGYRRGARPRDPHRRRAAARRLTQPRRRVPP